MSSLLDYLLNRYADKTCTPEEREELMQLLQQSENDAAVQQLLDRMIAEREAKYTMPEPAAAAVLEAIFQADEAPVVPMERKAPVRWMGGRAMVAAVILLLLVGAGTYWLLNRAHTAVMVKNVPSGNDVQPGGNKAILTLDDGSSIVLDSAANGTLAKQGNSTVLKNQEGQLVYDAAGSPAATGSSSLTYNKLTTPRGGQYQLVLPDGSKVWLNAASSIRYPTVFAGNTRNVQITGEVYFEVSPLPASPGGGGVKGKMPFIVNVDGKAEVEVLGTHFNINSYTDEASIKTTLLEGAVRLTQNTESLTLKPGQQAIASGHAPLTLDQSPNLDQVMAWKDGGFYFNGADIQTIMRQVARWYDVEVVYEDKIPGGHFKGSPSRNATLSQMLKILEYTGVKYSIQGKKIIIKE